MSTLAHHEDDPKPRAVTIVALRSDLRAALRSGRTEAASRLANRILDLQEAVRREERELGPFPEP